MPFIPTKPCKGCGSVDNPFRQKFSKQNNKTYQCSYCIPCERLQIKKHQQENKER